MPPKGKYFGPDKNKGVRPTGKDKYYGPNKHKGIVPAKKGKPKTANEKLADKITNAQYAGVLGQLEDTKKSNVDQYNRFVGERGTSLNREIGSNNQTAQIVQNTIAGRKSNIVAAVKTAAEKNALIKATRDQAVQAENTLALSNYEALLKSRGMEPSQVGEMTATAKTQQDYQGKLDEINRVSAEAQGTQAGTAMDTLATQAQTAAFNAEANARGSAQKDYNAQYSSTLKNNDEVAAELAKTKLEKGSSRLNTYLTLKKETAQRKAEEQAAALAAGVSMSKQASSDYFKELSANQNQQKIDISAEKVKLSSKAAQQKFLATQQKDLNKSKIDIARVEIAAKKAGVTLAPNWMASYGFSPTGKKITITSPSNPMNR